MAEISKQALKVDNNQSFPNNNNGAITPSILRAFNVNMIDSMVDEIGYNVDSASWNVSIDNIEAFTASLQTAFVSTASFNAFTSSINAYTASNNIKWNNAESATASLFTSVANLNAFTASQAGAFTELNIFSASAKISIAALNQASSSLQSFTQSANVSITNLNTTTASLLVETQNLELFTASAGVSINALNVSSASQQVSIDSLNSKTGSYATTGSNTFTGPNTFTSISASSFVSASAFVGDGSKITGITASISMPILDEGIPQGNAFSLNFTGSGIGATVVGGTAVISVYAPDSASFNALTASFNSYTQSTNLDLDAIHQATASLQQFTASFSTSSLVSTSSFNAYTASNDQRVTSLETNSGSVNTSITNLNQATSSLFGSASLGLTTASFDNGTRNLTFTKGDNTTFAVNIPDVSGSAGDFVTTSSFNAYTQSNDQRVSSLEAATSSYVTSAITASSLVTASAAGANITFTKGDASQFTISIATGSFVSASYAETASYAQFATDIYLNVKNTTGAQLNKGTVVRIIGATGDNALIQTASWTNDANSANTLGLLYENIANDGFGKVITQGTLLGINTDPTLGYTAGQLLYLSSSGQYTNVKPDAPYHEVRLGQVLRAQQNNGSMYVLIQNGYELDELHDVDINTGSLANNDLLAWDSASQQWTNKTVSGVGATTTSSFNSYTASNDQKVDSLIAATGSYATTGSNNFVGVETINSIAGTGLGEVYLLGRSGSLILGNSTATPTYAALSHLSSSQINANTNLIFKDNSNTGDTIISGSGNIFSNPSAPGTDRTNYIGGNTNLFLNGQSDQLPTITGSAASVSGNRPTMNANIFAGTQTWTINQAANPGTHTYNNNIINGVGTAWAFNTMGNTGPVTVNNNLSIAAAMTLNSPSRSVAQINAGESGSNALNISSNTIAGAFTYNGPVSSSTHAFGGNNIAGTATFNVQSGSRALSVTGNIINGGLTYNDNTVFAPTLGGNPGGTTLGNNNVNGTLIINQRASASFNILNNNINTWTISNDYDASAITNANQRFLGINGNVLFGAQGNNLYASGSQGAAAFQRTFANSIFGGTNISASVVANGGESNMASTIGVGHDLHVVGTARRDASNTGGAGETQGSAFFGRYNKLGQGFNTTAEVILAVGTGTSGSTGITRKTGFLIDSGSNTFIEGTLNVSGSTTMTGSLILSSSNAIELQVIGNSVFTGSVAGNVISASITSNTASIDFSLGNYFEVTSSVTPLHLNVTNIGAGRTSTLIISASASSSILFSPNVAQPSGSAYSGSLGSIDILSLVAFNTSRVNLVSTKALV